MEQKKQVYCRMWIFWLQAKPRSTVITPRTANEPQEKQETCLGSVYHITTYATGTWIFCLLHLQCTLQIQITLFFFLDHHCSTMIISWGLRTTKRPERCVSFSSPLILSHSHRSRTLIFPMLQVLCTTLYSSSYMQPQKDIIISIFCSMKKYTRSDCEQCILFIWEQNENLFLYSSCRIIITIY